MAEQSVSANDKMTNVDKELYPEMYYLMNADECDVQFVIDGQTVPSVKLLMCMKSEVFRAMFSGNWRESGGNDDEETDDKDSKIEIRDTTPAAFKVMIGFIYTEHLMFSDDNKDFEHIRDVLKLADRYQLKRLMTSIGKHLKSILTLDTIELIGRLAFDYQLDKLIARLNIFIDQNFKQLMAKPETELNAINTAVNNLVFEKLLPYYRSFHTMVEFAPPKRDNSNLFYRFQINGQKYNPCAL
ncbi:BTB/POZ domain-containing protein 9-like [Oppia nitens]|uniref:BTB/POZ domain-containing protein 9-like n=1 Tax=Oppia nitens TaxID=1686743 RepID=UPI0023DB5CF6|nr:BTB/POZ domain-containing protein 9-like [Oppia nitens]